MAIARGLDATSTLPDVGNDGNAGSFELGLAASADSGAHAYAEYAHRLALDDLNLSAFASAYVGSGSAFDSVDAGVTAGLKLEW